VADRSAFDGFYRANLARVIRACRLVLLDRVEAEDVAAEAFARLWSRWGAIHDEGHAGGFVFTTAMRLCARESRRRLRPKTAAGVAGVAGVAGTDEIGRALDRQEVAQALAGLSVRQRQAVVLRDWAGFDTSEVARLLGTREATVRVHVHRARQHLREALKVEEENAR
jgi:RNA polymerase sigma factor (sigma-70 family)